jgi:tungstate transport system substrate-binding protein
LGLLILILASWALSEGVLRLATTTSTYETGLLDNILPPFEKQQGIKVHVISVGTGKAIKLGENGDVDVILVHAREAEYDFVKNGFGINRRDVMYNEFFILGPKNDQADISGGESAAEAFKKIAEAQALFVSRGDESGTHKKEMSIWKATGLRPAGEWYMEVGQGMSAVLRLADEKEAYVLVDGATYHFNRKRIRLTFHVGGDSLLNNPYGVIAVSPYRHNHVRYEDAMALIAWLTSPKCQQMISRYKKNGTRLFLPNAAPVIKKPDSVPVPGE